MQIDDTLDDRKAEAGRRFPCTGLRRHPLETAEQSGTVLRRTACPLAPDSGQYSAVLLVNQQVDGSADRTVLDGAAYEVVARFADAIGVAHGSMVGGRGDRNGLFLPCGERPVR